MYYKGETGIISIPNMGYSRKAIKGLGWVGFLQVFSRGIVFIKYILIARFLPPIELGLFGIAMLATSFFDSVTDTGISAFLVQTHKTEEEYVSSAWLVNSVRGILLFLLTVLLAYPISIFFNSKSSFIIVLAASLIPLIKGFTNPATAKFQKHLDFDKEFIYRFVISVFDFFAAIILIVVYKNAQALVVSLIITSIFELVISFLVIKPSPRLIIERDKIKDLFHFGKWITALSSTSYFAQQLDSIVVGRVLGVESLGIYQLAQKFSLQIMVDTGGVFARVTFPLFSKIRDDVSRTKRAFMKIIKVNVLIFGSMALVLILFSKEILSLFVGRQWIGADIPIKIFSLTGLITAFMAIVTSLFLAHARQDITVRITVYRVIIITVLIIPASLCFGIIGTSSVALISYIVTLPFAVIGLRNILTKKFKS